MFVDFVKIYVKAGDGGDGAVSFHRERFVPFGGPDGGDGGKGGDIAFVADSSLQTLSAFKFKRRFVAENGRPGGKNNRFGRNGSNLIIKVPKGTLIFHAKTKQLMAEINSTVEPKIVARGGRGGFGNSRFKNSVRQSPKFAKPGLAGKEFELCLELKLLADVGLVGFPNVGKSTLISAISSAKPKIGNYAFTTLVPVLGVVNFKGNSFVAVDVPGLIEGAGSGAGLGHRFLRHVQKCKILVHLIDVSVFSKTSARFDIETINLEFNLFDFELTKKKQIIVANKVDCVNEQKLEELKHYVRNKGLDLFEISAVTLAGVEELLSYICEQLKILPEVSSPIIDYVDDENENFYDFKIFIKNGVYFIEADWLERLMRTSNVEEFENLQYFQKIIKKSGIEKELQRLNIQNGDLINVYGFCFEYFSD